MHEQMHAMPRIHTKIYTKIHIHVLSIRTLDMLNVPVPSRTGLIGRHNASCENAKRPGATHTGFALAQGAHQWAPDIGLNTYT